MSLAQLITDGFGNGTYSGTVTSTILDGFSSVVGPTGLPRVTAKDANNTLRIKINASFDKLARMDADTYTAATTLGSVKGFIEFYDSDGALVGKIPVYDAIT